MYRRKKVERKIFNKGLDIVEDFVLRCKTSNMYMLKTSDG